MKRPQKSRSQKHFKYKCMKGEVSFTLWSHGNRADRVDDWIMTKQTTSNWTFVRATDFLGDLHRTLSGWILCLSSPPSFLPIRPQPGLPQLKQSSVFATIFCWTYGCQDSALSIPLPSPKVFPKQTPSPRQEEFLFNLLKKPMGYYCCPRYRRGHWGDKDYVTFPKFA